MAIRLNRATVFIGRVIGFEQPPIEGPSAKEISERAFAHHNGRVQLPHSIRVQIENRAAELPFAVLKKAVGELSDHYRGASGTATIPLMAKHKALAYLTTRMPATFAAAHAVLTEVASRIDAPVSVLDLGAGTGAASLAALAVYPDLESLTLLDTDSALLSEAKTLLPLADFIQTGLPAFANLPEADIVVACYTLGELKDGEREVVIERAWAAARTALIILEPGTTRGFKNVLAMREQVLAAGGHMIAPCPHEGGCPVHSPDWCHFAQRVERTSLHRRLKDGELGYEDEKFSYVALSKRPVKPAPARIIRRPVHQSGFIDLTLCQGASTGTVRITKREKALFRAARHSNWGSAWVPISED